MGIDVPTDRLVSLFVECILFGIFSVLYAQSMWILLYEVRKRTRYLSRRNKILAATCTAMYLLAILHVSLSLQDLIEGFVHLSDTPGATIAYFLKLDKTTYALHTFAYVTTTMIGDSVLTYRVYLTWGCRRAVIILPIILLLSTAVMGYGAWIQTFPRKHGFDIDSLTPWIEAGFVLTLCTNILSSAMISGRIIWAIRQRRRHSIDVTGASLWECMEAVIQSALLYSAALLCLLGTYVSGSNAWLLCLDMMTPLIGVTFTLIIIRLGLGHKTAADEVSSLVAAQETTGTSYDTRRDDSRQRRRQRPFDIPIALSAHLKSTSSRDSGENHAKDAV